MAEHTHIEWTDATWNPITGCSIVSPGCTNCYAMTLAGTRLAHHPSRSGLTITTKAGPVWTGEVRFNEAWLDQPLRWRRPRMIFVCAHGDLFHESVPDEWIDKVFAVMALSPQHTFQVLTKRAGRMREYLASTGVNRSHAVWRAMVGEAKTIDAGHVLDSWYGGPSASQWPLPNVWLGVSAERQIEADERIPDLLATPAAVRFVSLEPLLGPIDLSRIESNPKWQPSITNALNGERRARQGNGSIGCRFDSKIDWVIVGGESGKGARPMHPDWARSLRDQCTSAGVPYFFKQWGEWGPGAELDADISARKVYRGEIQTLQIPGSRDVKLCIPTLDDDSLGPALTLERYGKARAGRTLDGRLWSQIPLPGTPLPARGERAGVGAGAGQGPLKRKETSNDKIRS